MSEWKEYRLKDLCSRLSSGKNIAASRISDTGAYPVYGGNGLRGYTDDSNFEGACALIGRQGAYCGNVRYFSGKGYMTEHAVVLCGNELSDSRFLSYYLSLQDLGRLSSQSAQPGLSVKVLGEEVFSVPDLPTQRRIAAVLGALDDKIENNRKICENLEAQAQALFKSWFVDFEPWGGKMPEEWKKGKLGDLAECNPFRRLPKGVDARCVEMADLVTNGAFPSGWSTKKYTGGMKFRNGDTIVARITPCFENGKAAFINFLEEDEVGFGSTEYVVISSCSAAPGGLFYSLVKSPDFITYAKSRMVGSSGRQRFNAEDVASFPLTIAPNNVYLELAPYYESIMEKIAQCGKESRALAEMRDALLPQLMSGRLRVDATACQGEIDVGKVEI